MDQNAKTLTSGKFGNTQEERDRIAVMRRSAYGGVRWNWQATRGNFWLERDTSPLVSKHASGAWIRIDPSPPVTAQNLHAWIRMHGNRT